MRMNLFPNRRILPFPNSVILFLRSTSSTRDDMQIVMRTPGGEVSYTIPVMKVKDYSLEEIFDRKLYFLIPFYIFTYENRFDRIERNQDMLDSLQQEYRGITDRLDQLAQDGVINTFYKVSIVDMTNWVLQNIAAKYENIRKGMGAIMGGQVLDYEARRLKYQFLEEGRPLGSVFSRLDRLAVHSPGRSACCRLLISSVRIIAVGARPALSRSISVSPVPDIFPFILLVILSDIPLNCVGDLFYGLFYDRAQC